MQETQVWTLGQEDSLEEEMATHFRMLLLFSNVQLFFATPWTAARQASLSFTISNSCPLSRWCIRPSHPLSSPSPPALNLSQHLGLFQWVSSLHQLAFSFSISLSNEYSGLISFRIDWFDLHAVKILSRIFSNTIQKPQFFSAQPYLWSNSHICSWLLEKP